VLGIIGQTTAARKSRKKKDRRAGPRTKMGAKQVRIRDLVHVKDPRDSGQEFTAEVTGGYTLEEQWVLQLGPVPGKAPDPTRPPRQSTPIRNVVRVYRRA
jgi:hypothetical protein